MAVFHTVLLAVGYQQERAWALRPPDAEWSPDSCIRLWGGSMGLINVTLRFYKKYNSRNVELPWEMLSHHGMGSQMGAVLGV